MGTDTNIDTDKLLLACVDIADAYKPLSDICTKYDINPAHIFSPPSQMPEAVRSAIDKAKQLRALRCMDRSERIIVATETGQRHSAALLSKAKLLSDLQQQWAKILVQDVYGDYIYQIKLQNESIKHMQKQLSDLVDSQLRTK